MVRGLVNVGRLMVVVSEVDLGLLYTEKVLATEDSPTNRLEIV